MQRSLKITPELDILHVIDTIPCKNATNNVLMTDNTDEADVMIQQEKSSKIHHIT